METPSLMTRVRKSAAYRVSRFGERLGIHSLLYNPLIMLEFHEHAKRDAPRFFNAVERIFPEQRRLLDVGSGSGAFVTEGRQRGLQVYGLECSDFGRWLSRRQGVAVGRFDLNNSPPATGFPTTELAYCLEVAEHLTPPMGDALVRFLATLGVVVIFTAAHPGQGGIGHINEQPSEYWVQRFEQNRMVLDEHLTRTLRSTLAENETAFWLSDTALVFLPNS